MKPQDEAKLILVLEDDVLVADDIAYALEQAGFAVATLASVGQALAYLGEKTPDAALVDYRLQDDTATIVAERLTERQIPFLVYSGVPFDINGPEVFQEDVWLDKPQDPVNLITAIAGLLARG